MGDIYRHDINLKDKQSITMFSKRSTPYNKAELARLLYMQGYRDQTTGLRVNTSSTPVVLYDSTGSNTDGAMTQKATTDALLDLASTIPTNASFTLAGLSEKSYNSLTDKPNIPEGAKLYDTYGSNTDGAMTQKATTEELAKKLDTTKGVTIDTEQTITGTKTIESLNLHGEILGTGQYEEGNLVTTANAFGNTSIPSMIKSIYRPQIELPKKRELLAYISDIPDISMAPVTGNIWTGYKMKFGKFCLIFGKMNSSSSGVKKLLFGETFSQIPIVIRTFQNGNAPYSDGIACGDLITYNVTTTYFEYNQRYPNRGLASFLIAGVLV